jgi:redox-sensing transcriptional repressor
MNLTLTVFRRLSLYLQYLKQLPPEVTRISATTIANELGLGEVLVRKELSHASAAAGRPKTGYAVATLIHALENFLGYNQLSRAVIIGAGKMGRALLAAEDFAENGMYIAAAFDTNKALIGNNGILPMENLEEFCNQAPVDVAIITVPKESAQEVCDRVVACGIRSVWCFAPVALTVPDGVLVHYENLAASMALLTHHLRNSI